MDMERVRQPGQSDQKLLHSLTLARQPTELATSQCWRDPGVHCMFQTAQYEWVQCGQTEHSVSPVG